MSLNYLIMSKGKKSNIYYRASKWFCSRYAEKDDIKYIALFLDMMIFQIFELTIILIISLYLGIWIEAILFTLLFGLARVGKKGIHADTKAKCVFWSTLMVISFAWICSYIGITSALISGYLMGVILRKR